MLHCRRRWWIKKIIKKKQKKDLTRHMDRDRLLLKERLKGEKKNDNTPS
jgi:hypothetical protein